MVSDGGPRDRGQLILIGAVAIAFILLGIVVVFNSVLYTQTIASSDTVESGVDAQTTELELERGASEVTQAVNRAEESDDDIEDALTDSDGALWEFVSQYGQTKAASKPTIVDVDDSEDDLSWEWGRLIHQQTTDEFTGDDDEVYVFGNGSDSTPARELGHLTMTIDVESVDYLEVTLEDESDEDNEIEFYGNDDELEINPDFLGSDCDLEPRGDGTVKVNLHDGTWLAGGADGDCNEALDLTSGLDNQYRWLEFESDDDAEGTYEVAVNGSEETYGDVSSSDAVWSYEFDYRYDTAEVTYSRTIEVDVYGGDS